MANYNIKIITNSSDKLELGKSYFYKVQHVYITISDILKSWMSM